MPSPPPTSTLDMLILEILSLEPAHGYRIAQRLEQTSRSVVQVNQGSLLHDGGIWLLSREPRVCSSRDRRPAQAELA
jgi:hypothetical protein